MARVKPEGIVDHLSSQFRRALAAAVEDEMPDVDVDEYGLFRSFKRALRRKCSTWERVPDRYVERD